MIRKNYAKLKKKADMLLPNDAVEIAMGKGKKK